MNKIFVVEDDDALRLGLCDLLAKNGYTYETTTDFENILDLILKAHCDMILLDLHLPYVDGYYLCREIRKVSKIPIVVLTSQTSDMDELMSINLGADDFIGKPYKPQILLARIENIFRRLNRETTEIVLQDVSLNLSNSSLSYRDQVVSLTKNEFQILYTLMKKPNVIISRNDLMDVLWQSDVFVDDNTLTVNINRLRKKLDQIGIEDFLKTKRGQGYII